MIKIFKCELTPRNAVTNRNIIADNGDLLMKFEKIFSKFFNIFRN